MSKLNVTIKDLFNIPGAEIFYPDELKTSHSVSIDTRTIRKGAVYFAIKGEKFDGHKFVEDAYKKGANVVVINKSKLEKFKKLNRPFIAVNDTTKAYGHLANILRKKYGWKIISITGSNGKTTTKEFLATLLKEKYNVVKSEANNNNHIGVPLTIFSASKDTDFIIIEHGTNHFGEIKYTADIAQPDFALITNIGESHIEFLKDIDGVFKEKEELFKSTLNAGGKLFVNVDDPVLYHYYGNFENAVRYGFNRNYEVRGKVESVSDEGNLKVKINFKNKEFSATLPVPGFSNAQNFIASAAVALNLGMNKNEILSGAAKLKTVEGRLTIIKQSNRVVINDSYNSSPNSVKAALELLSEIKTYNRKAAILGDIFELGGKAKMIHQRLVLYIVESNIQEIYTIGSNMKYLNKELKNRFLIKKHFESSDDLMKFIMNDGFEESVVLVKGSRGMKMEQYVELFTNRLN